MRAHVPTTLLLLFFAAVTPGSAQAPRHTGPIIQSGGPVFEVDAPDFKTPTDLEYKIAFEISQPASSPDKLNAALTTVARFMNMHAQAGVPRNKIHAAVVVHGGAGWEVLGNEAYADHHGVPNPNAVLIRELVDAGAQVILCGQTAASRGIPRDGLIPGVQVALSAMTALYALQEDGYRVNPW